MRRFVKFLVVAVLAAAVGALTLPGQGQVGGPPPGVIIKNPAESELSITVEMGRGVYVEKATAAEFIRFKLSQSAFVYLYEVRPNGEVRLLFPNRAASNNFLAAGEYAFPEDFMPGFPISAEGTHYVQVIATLLPVELSPGGELFRLLGTDPDVVRRGVESLIAQSGLTAIQWAANWTQYRVVKTQPTAGGYGRVTLKVVDDKNAAIRDALVKIEQIRPDGTTKLELDWTPVGTELSRQLEAGIKYRLQARRPTLFTPDPQPACQIRGVTFDPCVIELVENDNLQIIFPLRPIEGPIAILEVQIPQGPCVGKEIWFDASKSRPQDKIVSYLWDFGDGTLAKTSKESSKVTHVYLLPGSYRVRLIVEFTGGELRFETKTVEIQRPATLPACITAPPRAIEIFPSNDATRANVAIEGKAHTHIVRHGFAATLAPVTLPPEQGGLKLNFKYKVLTFPEAEVQAGEVFAQSFLSVVFVDKDGKPILQPQQIFPVIELGKVPIVERELDFSIRIPVPTGAKDIRVTLVTIVQAREGRPQTAPPGIAVTIKYSDFRLEQEERLSCQQVPLLLEPDKLTYGRGETVNWTFTNRLAQPVTLLHWQIANRSGDIIWGPVALNELKVEPNLSVRQSWEAQKDNQGKPAPAGRYEIKLEAREVTCTTIFEIVGP
jgi:PKD repeat protein